MKRLLNLITRRSNTPRIPENAEIILKFGGKTIKLGNVKSVKVETTGDFFFEYRPESKLQETFLQETAKMEIKGTSETANVTDTVKDFNEIKR